MIKEQRNLIFTNDDIRDAVIQFNREKKNFLPAGELAAIELGQGERPSLVIRVQVTDRIFENTIELTSEQLAGVLIHFCIRHQIPIPKKARKEIRRLDDGVILRIVIDRTEEARPPASVIPHQAGAA